MFNFIYIYIYILPLFSSIGFLLQYVLKAGEKKKEKPLKKREKYKNQPISFLQSTVEVCA